MYLRSELERQLLTPHLGIPNVGKISCHPRSSCDVGSVALEKGFIPTHWSLANQAIVIAIDL